MYQGRFFKLLIPPLKGSSLGLVILFIGILINSSTYGDGGFNGGGGSSQAAEMLGYASIVSELIRLGLAPELSIDLNKWDHAINLIHLSIDINAPLIVFSNQSNIDCLKFKKDACVIPNENGTAWRIEVSQPIWNSYSESDKIRLTTEEFLLLAGENKARYELANILVDRYKKLKIKDRTKLIESARKRRFKEVQTLERLSESERLPVLQNLCRYNPERIIPSDPKKSNLSQVSEERRRYRQTLECQEKLLLGILKKLFSSNKLFSSSVETAYRDKKKMITKSLINYSKKELLAEKNDLKIENPMFHLTWAAETEFLAQVTQRLKKLIFNKVILNSMRNEYRECQAATDTVEIYSCAAARLSEMENYFSTEAENENFRTNYTPSAPEPTFSYLTQFTAGEVTLHFYCRAKISEIPGAEISLAPEASLYLKPNQRHDSNRSPTVPNIELNLSEKEDWIASIGLNRIGRVEDTSAPLAYQYFCNYSKNQSSIEPYSETRKMILDQPLYVLDPTEIEGPCTFEFGLYRRHTFLDYFIVNQEGQRLYSWTIKYGTYNCRWQDLFQ